MSQASKTLQVMIDITEHGIDHGEALEVVTDIEFLGHAHATMQLHRILADETSRLKLLGMGRSLQIELPIEDAYVPLRTTLARSLEQRGTERFGEQQQ